MKCKKLKLISKYLDNQLNQTEALEILEHIKICKICKEEFEILKKIYSLLPEYKDVEVSNYFDSKLYQKLRNETEKLSILELLSYKPFRGILLPISFIFIFMVSIFTYKSCDNINRKFSSYEIYQQEDIDLAMFEIILNYYN